MDVPALVEKPHLYILLNQLTNNLQTSKGVPVVDVMHFFHGDGPEQQFESRSKGEEKMVAFPVVVTPVVYCFRSHHLSLADCFRIVWADGNAIGESNHSKI